jgi:predicted ester cyclase
VSEENKALVRQLIKEVEKGNLNVMDEVLAPDFVDHDLLPDQEPDCEGYKRGLSEDRAAFSNLDIAIEDQIAEGDKVVTRLTWRGTHDQGTFIGMAPTGKEVEVTAIFIHRIAGGKVKEEWSASDMLERLRQTGAAPEPGQSGETGPG